MSEPWVVVAFGRLPLLLIGFGVLAPALAGCVGLVEPDPDRVIAGHLDGDVPTNQYYKVHLVNDTGYLSVANFDRRDWYVRGLEQEIERANVEHATVQGRDRDLLNEVVAREVLSPVDLNEYRYDVMENRATAEGRSFDKAALDAEWDARLAELLREEPAPPESVAVPLEATSTLP